MYDLKPWRQSPIHHWLDVRGAKWGQVGDSRLALALAEPDVENARRQIAGLCDLSPLGTLGVKGPAAEAWLQNQGLDVSPQVHDACRLPNGCLMLRLSTDEFMLADGMGAETVRLLSERLDSAQPGVYRIEREEGALLLTGLRVMEVFAQISMLNFHEAVPMRLLLTRLAGVDCGILPESPTGAPAFRIWVDASYALYLWEVLETMVTELGGGVIGAACAYPEGPQARH
jgi:sarcosine oxidase subunit gamma